MNTLLNCARALASSSRIFCGSSLSLNIKSREKLFKSCSVCALEVEDKDHLNVEMNTLKSMIVMEVFYLPYVPNDFLMLPKDYLEPKKRINNFSLIRSNLIYF